MEDPAAHSLLLSPHRAVGTLMFFKQKPQTVATPVFTPPVRSGDGATPVSIRCETNKAEIYYSLDETEPTENSKQYVRVPVQVQADETLKAKAFKRGYLPSATAVWPAKVTPETAPVTSQPAQPNNQD